MFQRVTNFILNLPTAFRREFRDYTASAFFATSFCYFLLGLVARFPLPWTVTGTAILSSAGFIASLIPLLKKAWGTWWGKILLKVGHLLVAYLAVIQARNVVASATGLPAGNFNFTVGGVAAICYFPVWLLVAAATALLFGLYAAASSFTIEKVQNLKAALFGATTNPQTRSTARRASFNCFGHLTFYFVATATFLIWLHRLQRLEPVVRNLAYFADYEDAPLYPGLPKGKRVLFLNGGTVSFAEAHGWDVIISAEKAR